MELKECAMEICDIAYFAGFFDGEGSISISKRAPRIGKESTQQFELSVQVKQQFLDILLEMKQLFGGSI
ncbi:MAG: LAGLIDADG family homing endonuclease, partial [Nitrospirota bacterium]